MPKEDDGVPRTIRQYSKAERYMWGYRARPTAIQSSSSVVKTRIEYSSQYQ